MIESAPKKTAGQREIPKFIFPMAIIQEHLKKQLFVFLILLIFLVGKGFTPNGNWFAFVLVALVNYLIIIPLSMLAALVVVYLTDTRMLINFFTLFLMFASGIFWDIHSIPDPSIQRLVLDLNPFAFLIDAYRVILIQGQQPDWAHLGVIALGSLFLLASCLAIYERKSGAIARRVIA